MKKNKIQPGNNHSALEVLVDFLNFNFDPDDEDEPELQGKLLRVKYGWPMNNTMAGELWAWNFNTKTVRKVEKLQKELLSILIPIVPPARADSVTEADDRIWKLLQEIGKFEFQTGWNLWRSGSKLVRRKPWTSEIPPITQKRELIILGYKWLFGRDSSEIVEEMSFKKQLYLVVLETLEYGEFPKLKRCPWEGCQKFFVAEPTSMKACNKPHAREVDRIEAHKRVTEGRREKREAEQRKLWSAKERKGILYLLNILKLTRKGKLWDKAQLQKRKGLTHAFNRWQNNDSLNDIWGEFPDESKEVFIGYAERKGYKAL